MQKKINYKIQDNNQVFYKSKSCRAAEFSKLCKFSRELEAGLASITVGCLGGSLTGVLDSVNPSPILMVIGLFTDPSSQGKRKSSNPWATYLEIGVSVYFIPICSATSSIICNSPSWFSWFGSPLVAEKLHKLFLAIGIILNQPKIPQRT